MTDDMFPEELGAGETAIDYTNQFVDAGVAKLDAVFGEGYAKDNPAALAGYLSACGGALSAFMTASMGMMGAAMAENEDGNELSELLAEIASKAGGNA